MSPPAPGFGAFLDGGGRSSATLLAGRPLHWHYESLLLKSLFLADLPSILAMVPVNLVVLLPLTPLHLGFYVISYLTAGIWLLGASGQWLVVGSWLEQRIESTTWGRRHRQQTGVAFIVLIVVILAGSLRLTPIVNARSGSLGFRHGGISFY